MLKHHPNAKHGDPFLLLGVFSIRVPLIIKQLITQIIIEIWFQNQLNILFKKSSWNIAKN